MSVEASVFALTRGSWVIAHINLNRREERTGFAFTSKLLKYGHTSKKSDVRVETETTSHLSLLASKHKQDTSSQKAVGGGSQN